MSQGLPQRVEPIRFAREGRVLHGSVALSPMRRLGGYLATPEGSVEVSLTFEVDQQGNRVIEGRVIGELQLVCQRCLEPMRYPLELEFRLGVVRSEYEAQFLSAELEPLILETETIAVSDLIEDELILAVPLVPRHAADQACAGRQHLGSGTGQQDETEGSAKGGDAATNPFAALERLKR